MKCNLCGKESRYVSQVLGVCLDCIRTRFDEARPFIIEAHSVSRRAFDLPPFPPRDSEGLRCSICTNECSIPSGEKGYCGLRENLEGRLIGPSSEEAKVSWYLDPLPTNCVADWVCPGGTGCGYPKYAYRDGPERGYYNLAVFFHACSLNCLFCQNWHFRELTLKPERRSVEDLLRSIGSLVSCVCFFGGDPSPQLPFAINVSENALRSKGGRILRICWETNGMMSRKLLERVVELSLSSGGCIKFDLKAWSESLHIALTGLSNKEILENFTFVAQYIGERPEVPLLVASTLLVPGYVDEMEVRGIASFIASLNVNIPYRLLAFSPQFYMRDLPLTPKELAYRCYEIAKNAGLKNVSIGNVHLLR